MNDLIEKLEAVKNVFSFQENYEASETYRSNAKNCLKYNKNILEDAYKAFSKFHHDYDVNRHRSNNNNTKGAKYKYGFMGKFNTVLEYLDICCSENGLHFAVVDPKDWERIISDVKYVLEGKAR